MTRHSFDLVIVGSGPAGLSAAGHAQANGMDYVVLERTDHLADTIHCYQKRKPVMAEPAAVPLRSELAFAAGPRESVLGQWQAFVRGNGLNVHFGREMSGLERDGEGFLVRTGAGDEYAAPRVVLALGTQGNPRRLGVPGEDLLHVSTRLVDPDEFSDRDILVVGAGDSALEVALALTAANRVGLVVRTPEILRAKESLEREILQRQATGQLRIHFSSAPLAFAPGVAVLKAPEGELRVPADRVIVKIGATAPRALLEGCGVRFAGEGREAKPVLSPVYESSLPGLFLIGAVTGRDLIKLGINQGFEVIEHLLGRVVVPADEEVLAARLPWWRGAVRRRIEQIQEQVPVLGAADDEHLREVFLSAEVREYRDGEVILRQNDYSDTFLIVAAGAVEITARSEAGSERRVATLGASDFFGEMSLISGRRRNATAAARGAVRLIEVPRKAMLKLMATNPSVKAMVDQAFLVRAFQGYLFPDLAADLLRELAAMAGLERLDKGQVLFREGDPGDAFYLIRSGQLKISQRSGGQERVLAYLVAGNSFGETALRDGATRTATVTTIFPCELIKLAKADFDRFLAARPQLRAGLLAKLEEWRVTSLVAEAMPAAGSVLSDLIRTEVVMGTQALFIDEHKCVRCGNCIDACEGVHEDGQTRLVLQGIKFYNLLAPNSCWQCENPLCMTDCPPDAIARDPHGEVYIKSNCIGCGKCAENCPYGNIFMVHPKADRALVGWVKTLLDVGSPAAPVDSGQTVAVKCDLCRGIAGGPACVRSCPTGAAIRLEPDEYQQRLAEIVVREGAL